MGWWIAGIAFAVIYGVLYAITNTMSTSSDSNVVVLIVSLLLMLAISLISLSINVRRWHDLNKSGWWVLINLIPIVGGLYSLIMLGFMGGDQGHNSYGAPPEEGAVL